MRRLFASFGLMFGLSSMALAQGGIDYSNLCKWDEGAKPRANRDRVVQTLEFTGATSLEGATLGQQELPVAGAGVFGTSTIYFDKTGEAPIQVSRGDVITVQPRFRALYWTHFYLYIDYNQDGLFGEDELVSFTHYREGSSGDYHNSVGAVITSGDVYDEGRLPVFTIPQTAKSGQTRARFKADWNNKDACGAGNLHSNRGTICDFTLEVLAPAAGVPTTTFTMNVDSEHGTALLYDKATNQPVNPAAIPNGTELELRVTPSEGYRVSELKINDVDKLKELKNGKLSLTAEGGSVPISVQFQKKDYGVFVTKFAAEGVEIVVRNAQTQENIDLMSRIEHGTQILLFATPPAGYRFSNFVINSENKLDEIVNAADEGLLITMTKDLRIMFTIEEHRVNFVYDYDGDQGVVTATLEDGITPVQSGGTVSPNSVVFIKIEPKEGYEFAGITSSQFPELDLSEFMDKVSGTDDTYIVEVEDYDVDFTVHFRQKSGVEELKPLGYAVRRIAGGLVVEGLIPGDLVELYDASGVCVAKSVAIEHSVSLFVDKGVYILKIGRSATKLVIR